jgi:hypothetical protein
LIRIKFCNPNPYPQPLSEYKKAPTHLNALGPDTTTSQSLSKENKATMLPKSFNLLALAALPFFVAALPLESTFSDSEVFRLTIVRTIGDVPRKFPDDVVTFSGEGAIKTTRAVELTAGDEEEEPSDFPLGPGGSIPGGEKRRRDVEFIAGDDENEDDSYVPGPGGSIPNYGDQKRRGVEFTLGDGDDEDDTYVPGPGGSIPNYPGDERRRALRDDDLLQPSPLIGTREDLKKGPTGPGFSTLVD